MSTLLSFLLSQCDQFKRGRLPSLYSDFTPQRYSNPDGFAANIAAWQQGLTLAAQAGVLPTDGGSPVDTLSVKTGELLLQALETKEFGRPLALETVINESISHRKMMPLQDFISEARNINGWDWKVQPWWFLSWGLQQIGILGSSTLAHHLQTGQFVVMANVEKACSEILRGMATETNQVERIYPMSEFREKAGSAMGMNGRISDNDLSILLTSLSRDKKAVLHNYEVVKFKIAGDKSTALSPEDKTIASLKLLVSDLTTQIDTLSKKISSLTAAAQEAVGNKNRILALSALKSKKLKQSALVQRTDTLSQVEEILQRIEQAHDQVTMIKVMKASTSVLQDLRSEAGEIDKVETIVEDLRDEMQQVDEMGKVLEAGGQGDVDEVAIDEELEQLMSQSKAKEDEEAAQATQRRLAEIEELEAKSRQPTQPGQDPIDADISALKRLSLKEQSLRPSDQPEAAPAG